MSKKKTVFNEKWLEEDQFKEWLVSAKDNGKARCKLCKKDIELSNMGRQALLSHCGGKQHKEVDLKVKTFFQPAKKPKEKDSSRFEQSEPILDKELCPSKAQASIELVIRNHEKFNAEILWTLKSLIAGHSNNSCSNVGSVFQQMFPDSHIAKSFQLGATKMKYLTNFGIAPYFKSLLVESVKESPCHVLSFDDSLNPVTQTSEMDL